MMYSMQALFGKPLAFFFVGTTLLLLSSTCHAQIAFDDTNSPAGIAVPVTLADGESLEDFCFEVGLTHPQVQDLEIVLNFESIQGGSTDFAVVDEPSGQLDPFDSNTPVFFTTYPFHTLASEIGQVDQDPISGFFYAPVLTTLLGENNAGTWTVKVSDKADNGNSGVLTSFTPHFNDPAVCGQSMMPSTSPSKMPSPTPVNTPSPGGDVTVVLCFSGYNTVDVRGKGEILLRELEIGDYVKEASGGYTKVYSYLHYHEELSAEFLQISYSGPATKSPLEVSPQHLVFSRGRAVAASAIKVGDVLDGDKVVTSITTVIRKGVYAPATESGELMVAGVRSSNYVQLLPTSAFSQHSLSHAGVAPLRWFCRYSSSCETTNNYTADGHSPWIVVFLNIAATLNQWPPVASYVWTLISAPVALLLSVLEYVPLAGIAIGLLVAARLFSSASKRAKND